MKVLTENTLIPIGLAILAIGGGSAWVTKMWLVTEAHSQSLERLEQKGDYYVSTLSGVNVQLQEIRERLIKIETILNKER